jgi:hypothetical protein
VPKRKDPAAVALGRKGGKARLVKIPPERRTEIARHAVLTRYAKTKPPWYGVLLIPVPEDAPAPDSAAGFPEPDSVSGFVAWAKIGDAAHCNPQILMWSQDWQAVVERLREEDKRGNWVEIVEVDYDPRRFAVRRKFTPDADALRQLLKVDVDPESVRLEVERQAVCIEDEEAGRQ